MPQFICLKRTHPDYDGEAFVTIHYSLKLKKIFQKINIERRCQSCSHLPATPDRRGKEIDNKYRI